MRRKSWKADIEDDLDYLLNDNFRVSVFGSARISENHDVYNQTYALARMLANANIDVITGGGGGVMEAANKGHKSVQSKNNVYSIGLGIKLPQEQKFNDYVEIQRKFRRFSRRLDQFMFLSNIIVVMDGGIGTCLELFYAWQLIQVQHMHSLPIILVGSKWSKLIDWVRSELLENNYLDQRDLDSIHVVNNNAEVMQIVISNYQAWQL